ncbi:hypothetical protein NECAME_12891 [Necator americanus]|uniref:Uncharacterized protein n=1 Tax=Necator americanus TaxID=51031 RepID=W2SZY8_NECAM|nr:hypothetical protein NECAME_12891 [Necator americanus]ETN74581.1 hypothetical protein NECAME_12891 [Necator americanus]
MFSSLHFFTAYLAEVVSTRNLSGFITCFHAFAESKNLDALFMYEACIRKFLGQGIKFGKIKILPKGTGWARDNWLTNSIWNAERDFMIHNWKLPQLRTYNETPLP